MTADWQLILPVTVTVPKGLENTPLEALGKFSGFYHRLRKRDKSLLVPSKNVLSKFCDFFPEFSRLVYQKATNPEFLCGHNTESTNFRQSNAAPYSPCLCRATFTGRDVGHGWPFHENVKVFGLRLFASSGEPDEGLLMPPDMETILEVLRKEYPRIVELLFICAY
jgi:hypothetical protein